MTVYIIFFIVYAIICIILCSITNERTECYYDDNRNKKSVPAKQLGIAYWLYYKDGANKIFITLFVLIGFGSPMIYEFPRINTVGMSEDKEYEKNPVQSYMYIKERDSEKFYKEKLSKFGSFQSFNQSVITKKVSTEHISVTRVFAVYEERTQRTIKFRVWITGDDWSQFLLEIYNSGINVHPLTDDHRIIFDHLQKIFENENIAFEQFPEVAEKIGNEWLKKHKINSVRFSVKPDKRRVWVE